MPHSCGRHSVKRFLEDKSDHAASLFEHFSKAIHDCGPVKLAPAKTRVGFQVRMIFAAVNKLNEQGLEAHVVLSRRLNSPRFKRIDTMSTKCYVHHFKISSVNEIDEEVREWLREAYLVGTQKHLSRR